MDLAAVWKLTTENASSSILVTALLVLWKVQVMLSTMEKKLEVLSKQVEDNAKECVKSKTKLAKVMKAYAHRHQDEAVDLLTEG